MNGRAFLPAARRLAGSSDEADLRSAASRAYYAAFHAARDLLAALRFRVPRSDRAHNYLYVRLNNCGVPVVRQAADQLLELRRRRNVADYDVQPSFPANAPTDAIADAVQVLRTLDTLTPAERTRITDAMKLYEQQISDVTWQP